MDWVRSQRSHSWTISDFRFLLLHQTRPIYEPWRALVIALVFVVAKRAGRKASACLGAPELLMAPAAFATGPRPMQSPKRLVGCIERSQVAAASDSPSIKSGIHNLSVSEKKREEYYWAIPQNSPSFEFNQVDCFASFARLARGPLPSCVRIPSVDERAVLAFEQDAFGRALQDRHIGRFSAST